MVNWTLESCCGDAEAIVFLGLYVGYTVLTYFLMETAVAKPLKLIAIFIHEMGQYVWWRSWSGQSLGFYIIVSLSFSALTF